MNPARADPSPAEPARARQDAVARGLHVDFVSRGPVAPGETAAGLDAAAVVKTVVVQRGEGFVFVLVPIGHRFSWAKLRRALGVSRLSLPDADAAFAATGYRRGTITPLGAHTPWPVVVDQRIVGHRIVLGSGDAGYGALLGADDLVRAYAATVIDLTV